jgi:hypothetical protein
MHSSSKGRRKVLLIGMLISLATSSCSFDAEVEPLVIESPPAAADFEPSGIDVPTESIGISSVSLTDLSVFFSQYEDNPLISAEILEKYLTDPALMAVQVVLIQDLVTYLDNGGAPLDADGLYQMSLERTGDPGTALLVCHNILKAMARGRSPIPWSRVSGEPLTYPLGDEMIVLGEPHPDAISEWP